MLTKMNANRRWWWLGGVVIVAGAALVAGQSFTTLLYLAAILACPAAMFFGMGMMGRTQSGSGTPGVPGPEGPPRVDAVPPALPAAAPGAGEAAAQPREGPGAAVSADGEPMAILKRRLAAGAITLDEYERVAAVLSGTAPAAHDPAYQEGATRT